MKVNIISLRRVVIFTKREYLASVKTKGFIIGLIIAPILMCGSLIAFLLLKDRVDTRDKTIAIVDHSGVVASAIIQAAEERNRMDVYDKKSGKKKQPLYNFQSFPPDATNIVAQRFQLSEQVRNRKFSGFLEIGSSVVHPGNDPELNRIAYYANNAAFDDVRRWVGGPINSQLRKLRLADAGIAEEKLKDLFYWINVDGMGLIHWDTQAKNATQAKRASEIEALLIPIFSMMLMFLMTMMTIPGMLQSVMEEKTQRIAEVLFNSLTPSEFMVGKLLGGVALAITSSLVYILGAVITLNYMNLDSLIPYRMIPWFFAYMPLAMVMFGSIATALGAACSDPKDAQSLTFPAILPAIFPMFIYFPIARQPLGDFATWMSLCPPFTPMLMVLRLATPETIPLWQPMAGLVGILIFTGISVWLGGRIFRVAILLQDTPPKFKNFVRWAISG